MLKSYILFSTLPKWNNDSGIYSFPIEGVINAESPEKAAQELGGELIQNRIVFKEFLFKNKSRYLSNAKEYEIKNLVFTLCSGEKETSVLIVEAKLIQ